LSFVIWLLFIGRLTLSIKATAEAATLAATVAHLIRFCLFAGDLPLPHGFSTNWAGSENLPQCRQTHMLFGFVAVGLCLFMPGTLAIFH